MMPAARTVGQSYVHFHPSLGKATGGRTLLGMGAGGGYQRLTFCQPLHAAVGSNPATASHIAVTDIGLESQTETLSLLRSEDKRLPPMFIKHLVGSISVAMHLVVIDHSSHPLLFECLQVGSDTLSSGLCLTEKPPHFRAGRILWMIKTIAK